MKTMVQWVAVGLLTLSAGCSAGESEGESVASDSAPLLGMPSAFYRIAPNYAWCLPLNAQASDGCHAGYSFNSAGANGTSTRVSTGRYRITFPGQPVGGNSQVTAHGNAHCSTVGMAMGADGAVLDVTCVSPTNAPVDSRFQISYYKDVNVGGPLGGYALVRAGGTAVQNTWNSSGAAVTSTRLGVGSYRVNFPGQPFGGDTVQVTAAGIGYCKVANWSAGVSVDVRCFATNGVPADLDASVFYGRNIRGEPRNTLPTGVQGAFSVVSSTAAINAMFSLHNCTMGTNTAATFALGEYTDRFHAVTQTAAEIPIAGLVTALGSDNTYCNLRGVPIQGVRSDSTLIVHCFDPNGVVRRASSHVDMVFLKDIGGGC